MCLVQKIAQHCEAQHNVCDHTGWLANPAHHEFNPGEPDSWWARSKIDICKKISTQPDSNPWWTELAHGF